MATNTAPNAPRSTIVSGRTLGWIGTTMVLLSLVFLYRWGVTQGWITELARVATGGVISIALLGAGLFLPLRRSVFSGLLQGAGVAGLFLTVYASYQVYELTDQTMAFVQLVAVAVLAIGLAVAQRRQAMAVIGVAGAFAAPLLIGGHLTVGFGDAGYLAIVVLAVGVIMAMTGWEVLFSVTAGATALVTLFELAGGEWALIDASRTERLILLGSAVLGLYGGPILHAFIKADPQPPLVSLIATGGVTLGAFAGAIVTWGIGNNPLAWAVVAVAMAVLHVGVAYAALGGPLRTAQYFPAVVFVALAGVLALDGSVLLLVWAAQATALIVLGRRDPTGIAQVAGGVGYGLVALAATARLFELADVTPVFNGDGLSLLGVFLLSFVIAYRMPSTTADQRAARAGIALLGYVAVLGWMYAELVRLPAGQAAPSIGWALTGLALTVVAWTDRPAVRNVGLATLLVTVAKLFLIDLAEVSGGWKIILFMGIGAMLLILGYFLAGSDDDQEAPQEDQAESQASSKESISS